MMFPAIKLHVWGIMGVVFLILERELPSGNSANIYTWLVLSMVILADHLRSSFTCAGKFLFIVDFPQLFPIIFDSQRPENGSYRF